MNEQMNAPMSPESAGFAGWFSTWMNAVSKPSEQNYAVMAAHPDANPTAGHSPGYSLQERLP